jgi:uncharacterized protein
MTMKRQPELRARRGAWTRTAAPVLCALAATLVLGACSSVALPRFHSLMPAPAASTGPVAKVTPAGTLAWEILPVTLPPGVDQPQWVVRSVDGSLVVLEQERWVGPLGEEVRAAVSAQLVELLGPPAAGAVKPWRVAIEVQRFESAPGREALVDVVWSVASDRAALRCRVEFVDAVGADGYLALAAGHRNSMARLAGAIAEALKALGAGSMAHCQT